MVFSRILRFVPYIQWSTSPSVHGNTFRATTEMDQVTGAGHVAIRLSGIGSAIVNNILNITAIYPILELDMQEKN